jgi:hypothetical protein
MAIAPPSKNQNTFLFYMGRDVRFGSMLSENDFGAFLGDKDSRQRQSAILIRATFYSYSMIACRPFAAAYFNSIGPKQRSNNERDRQLRRPPWPAPIEWPIWNVSLGLVAAPA